MTLETWRKKLEQYVTAKAHEGMVLTLNGKQHKCIEVVDDSDGYGQFYDGKKYIFDTGLEWTIGDICANIELKVDREQEWELV